jgi:hypothetical protein
MDNEELAEARQRAQDALSRARLAKDLVTKKLWEEAAENWKERLAELESRQDTKPSP